MKIKSSHKKIFQISLISIVLFIALKEFYSILINIDKKLFYLYADKLTFDKLLIVAALGIISYLPLSFYDLLVRKRVNINLKLPQLYKYSWIASSISNVVGLGGSSAIILKNYFYSNYTDDNKKLTKILSKIVVFNLSGFAMVCLVFSISNIIKGDFSGLTNIAALLISLYIPITLAILIRNYFKSKDSGEFFFSINVCLISISEWITTIILIYGLMLILDVKMNPFDFLSVYVSAIIVAMISMTPSGVGTFDLALLVGLGNYGVPSEQVLLLILLYRISYYLVPMIIGIMLYLLDLYKKVNSEVKDLMKNILATTSHFILCAFIFLLALSMLCFFLHESIIPAKIANLGNNFTLMDRLSPTLTITLSFLLIISGKVLYYKSIKAYWINFALLVISSPLIIFTFGLGETVVLIIILILLITSKSKFYRKGFIMTWSHAFQDLFIFLSILTINLFLLKFGKIRLVKVSKLNPELLAKQKEYFTADLFLALGVALIFIVMLIYNNSKNKFPKHSLNKEKLSKIISTYGGSRLIHYAFLEDKYIYINKSETVALQYQISSNKIVVLGNPVGNEPDFINCIEEFYSLADIYGYTLVFTAIDEDLIPTLHDMGFEFMKLGEDAFVDLESFSLVGNKNKSKRQAVSRIEKYEYTFSVVTPPYSNDFIEELRSVSDEWLKGQTEKGFSIGFFDIDYLSLSEIAIVKNSEGEIKAFANLMPMYDNNETISVDLIRFKEIDVNGIMDFLLVKIFEYGKEHGYRKFNMGLAPLSNVGESKYAFLREKIAYQIFQYGNMLYSFSGLKNFKKKYASIWENRYIAYRKNYSLLSSVTNVLLIVSRPTKKIPLEETIKITIEETLNV